MKKTKFCLTLCATLALSWGAQADENTVAHARARAALALAKAHQVSAVAPPVAPSEQGFECYGELATAQAEATRRGLPLVIWIGMTCESEPNVKEALSKAVHCHQDAGPGQTPCVQIRHPKQTWQFAQTNLKNFTPAEMTGYLSQRDAPAPSGTCPGGICSAGTCSTSPACQGGNCGAGTCPIAAAPVMRFAPAEGGSCSGGSCGTPTTGRFWRRN